MPTKKKNSGEALAKSIAGDARTFPDGSKVPETHPDRPIEKTAKEKSVESSENTVPYVDKGQGSASASEMSVGQSQVVAALISQGYSYHEAVAMLSGSGEVKPGPALAADEKVSAAERERIRKLSEGDDSDLPPVEDVEDKFEVMTVELSKRDGFKTLIDDLWARRQDLEDVAKKTLYRVTFDIPASEFDWLLHRTISEGQARKDAEYSVQSALVLLLKQQKALDPTRGGRRGFGSSGPKADYNPAVGGWTK